MPFIILKVKLGTSVVSSNALTKSINLLLVIFFYLAIKASAEVSTGNAIESTLTGNVTENASLNLDNLTRKILLKEIEIGRLNTTFRMETTLISPWRQRRVFLYGEANACCAEAASIITIPPLYKAANPKTIFTLKRLNDDRTQLVAATRTTLVGQSVGAGVMLWN